MIKTKIIEITYQDQPLRIEYFLRPGKGETVLYLHGLGCSKDDFIESADVRELEAHTLVGFDFPGCGRSPYPENVTIGIDDLVEITNIFVSRLSLGDLVVVAHSMGGLVGLLYVKNYSEHVKGFVNIEGNLASEDCFFSRKVIQYDLDGFKKTLLPKVFQNLSGSTNKGYKKHFEIFKTYSSPKAIFDCCPSLVDYSDNGNLIQVLAELKIPKLFIHGSENSSLSYIPMLKEKGCEVVEIAGADHFPGYDNPRDFYKVISSFVKG